jgi:hypothetical protein
MGQLPTYNSFADKNEKFVVDQRFNRIDTVDQFDDWYSYLNRSIRDKSENSKIESPLKRGFIKKCKN